MPRGKRSYAKGKSPSDAIPKHYLQEPKIDVDAEGFYADEVDDFHRKRREELAERVKHLEPVISSEEEDVLGIDVSDSEEEFGKDYEDKVMRRLGHGAVSSSDEEDDEANGVAHDGPSEKAWGRKKSSFYNTDYVDDELGAASDEDAAEQEEMEAIALQKRMDLSLQETDFEVTQFLDPTDTTSPSNQTTSNKTTDPEIIVQDLSQLSREEKLEIVAKESPELFELLGEFREKLAEVILLQPLLNLSHTHTRLLSAKAREWLKLKCHLYVCYCTNIAMYLLLKSHNTAIKSHPVISEILEYRKLVGQLQLAAGVELEEEVTAITTCLAEHGEEELVSLLSKLEGPSSIDNELKQPKKTKSSTAKRKREDDPLEYYYQVKRAKEVKKKRTNLPENDDVMGEADTDASDKRAITYEISRNKGLVPSRKKEQRNPRVKHRKKYRKALIKRKSQVPDVVKELSRYGGELSGIRSNLSHSIKIK